MDVGKPKPNGSSNAAIGKRLTRKRIPLSCLECRVRKLKCNREKPCQNCIVRGSSTANSCTYAEKPGAKNAKSNPRSDAEDMRKRINRLESSILSMMSSDGNRNAPQNSTSHVRDSNLVQENGHLEPDEVHTTSIDSRSTHWDVILNDLGEMKEAWREENDYTESSNGHTTTSLDNPRPNLINGLMSPPDRATVLASLPPKPHADKLITRFFSYYNPVVPAIYIVHEPTFLIQYEAHWVDPTKSKILWVGLLFGMLCHALQSYQYDPETVLEYHPALADLYRTRIAQCISIAQVTKPVKHMIETMHIYNMVEFSDEGEEDLGSWLIGGSVMRMAMQQGWHRDPSQHPNVSVFEGEMRRRLWAMISQYDLMLCTKAGIPKSTRYSDCDVSPPSNLYPWELYEEMTQLPPSRPLTEDTPMSYIVTKYQLMRAYGRVIEFLHIVDRQPYSEVLKLDILLTQQGDMIPSYLQVRPLDGMQNDRPSRVMERYLLMLLYNKVICLLHRKYWNERTQDAPNECAFHYSRKTCVSSAMVLLEQQSAMHQASQPGGVLAAMKWYHFPVANHDFLLAAMILSLDLMGLANDPNLHGDCIIEAFEKFHNIKKSRDIWAEIVDDCKDARRAVRLLDRIIPTLITKFDEGRDKFPMRICPITGSAPQPDANVSQMRYSPYSTDEFRQNLPSIADPSVGDDTLMQNGLFSSEGIIDSMTSGISMPDDFDWDTWDQLITQ